MQTAWKYIVAGLLALVLTGLAGCNQGGSSNDLAQNTVPGDPNSGSEGSDQTFIDEPTGGPMPGDDGGSGSGGGGSEDDGGSSDGGGGSDSGGGSGGDGGGTGEDPGDPVPEPTTIFLIGSGLASLAYYRKRRREGENDESENTPAV